jgi:hypothetical protein
MPVSRLIPTLLLILRKLREIKKGIVFTGLEPFGVRKYLCVPKFAIRFGFTGRISTPSLLKNLILPRGKSNYIGPHPPRPNRLIAN